VCTLAASFPVNSSTRLLELLLGTQWQPCCTVGHICAFRQLSAALLALFPSDLSLLAAGNSLNELACNSRCWYQPQPVQLDSVRLHHSLKYFVLACAAEAGSPSMCCCRCRYCLCSCGGTLQACLAQ
jgi:hypothetical protein